MDTVLSIFNVLLAFIPMSHLLTAIGAFLVGCWFYRYMLKRNPERLQTLVDVVNNSPKFAKSAFSAVTGVKDTPPKS